ncbi:Intraflagellar_transport protein 72/74 [Hexamita inflata]|uniref:Intraflagellar transport protein 72/74 n=1 Tax=Hexamita inflata TaxID=28002 RepID=A0AA86RFB0_9EUKA|nr:Intraflagellar transport protein 72/74 [Hexamita inflata]CAI9977444.1 Intraflagellar transport protein 72/74 [Hexamita inflata]
MNPLAGNPTLMRKQSARPMSRGQMQIGATGKAASTTVDLVDRPMSGHGMSGTRAVSGTRQVRDATFFATELRARIQSVNKETDALTNSTNELKKREVTVTRLDDSVKELRQRVTALQGELFDITHAQSRSKEGASLEDLRTDAQKAEDEATKLRNEANIAFKAREEALQRLEKNEIAAQKIRSDTEHRILNDLGEEAARQFRELSTENNTLAEKEQQLRKQLQEQSQVTAQAYANAFVLQNQQNQQNITKAIELHRQIRACKREIDQLRSELQKDQSEDPEFSIKQQLKNQIKTESNECKRLMDEIKNMEAAIANRKRILTEITPDVMTAVTKEQKEMIKNVLKAEKQLGEWPRQKQDLSANTQRLQQQTMALLQRLPAPMARTEGGEQNVEQQLSIKTRELERLSDQEQKVLTELRDCSGNVQQLNETLSALQQAVGDAEAVDDIAGTEAQLKKDLAKQVDQHKQLSAQLAEANQKLNKLEEDIQNNENVKTLRDLFGNLSSTLSKMYSAETYIKTRENESDFQKDKQQAVGLMDGINKQLNGLDKQ